MRWVAIWVASVTVLGGCGGRGWEAAPMDVPTTPSSPAGADTEVEPVTTTAWVPPPGCGPTTTTAPELAPDVAEPALRLELLELMRQDQLERTGDPCLEPGTKLGPTQDNTRARRLQEVIDEHGWPGFDLVGEDGAEAAWVIAQHADDQPDFQAEALALLTAAVAAGQASPGDLAYLTDRVAVNEDRPQTYGTQVGCVGGQAGPATPIEDEAGVDARRAAAGLGPLAEYYAELGPCG